MDNNYDSFWSAAIPGMLNIGTGLYTSNLAMDEAKKRLAAAQGPLFNQANNAASGMLSAATGGFDPQAFATQRFNAQQALVQPKNDADVANMMTALRAKGQLGLGVTNPGIEGYTPTPGVTVNPMMAALFAGQSAGRNQAAYNSMGEGQRYIDSLLNRSGMLSRQAQQVQQTGLTANAQVPSRAAQVKQLLSGGLDVLKNTGITKKIPGLFGDAYDWLGNTTGLWQASGGSPDFANYAFSNEDWT